MTFPLEEPNLETILKGLQRRLHPRGRVAMHSPKYDPGSNARLAQVPLIRCKSGFSFSMQADRFAYCEPRDDIGPWTEVELSHLSKRVDALIPYAENELMPLQTLYGWVPLKEVAELVLKEGGFA